MTTRSGACAATAAEHVLGVAERRDDLVAGVGEEAAQALAQERLVLGDHDPHGSSAISAVPAPSVALDPERPAARRDAIGQPAQARALRRRGAADAVVGHAHDEPPVLSPGAEIDAGRVGVLDGVREPLAGDEVGRGLDARGRTARSAR